MVLVARHIGITYREKCKSDASRAQQTGYIVQVRGKTIGGFHKTYASAVETLRQAKGVTSSKMLPLKTKYRKEACLKGLRVPYLFCRRKRWYSPQVPLGKTYPTAELAMQAVKKSREGKTFLSKAKKRMKVEKSGPIPPGKLAHRVRCLLKFTLKDPTKKWLPPDAAAAAYHRVASSNMYNCDVALHFISLLLKFGPWKDMLLECWQKGPTWPTPGKRAHSPESRACEQVDFKQRIELAGKRSKALSKLLQSTAHGISCKPVQPEWGANANRHGSHFNGPASQMHPVHNCIVALVLKSKCLFVCYLLFCPSVL